MNTQSRLILFVAVLASLLEIIDTSIVNVAIPTMMGNLGATLEDISMVITGYAIANAIVLPLSAWLGEQMGRRKYYLGCIALFTITSIACGLAPNLFSLIIFRILQGLAGGALLPTSQALIFEQFPREKAGMAGALFGMSVMIGPTLGPTLGGYLTDQFGWRSIFNINLPLGLLALFVGFIVIQEPSHVENKKSSERVPIDVMGLVLLTLGIGCLQYTLERGEPDDWFSSKAIIFTALTSAFCLPYFVYWELKVKHPIINIRLFKDRNVACGTILMANVGVFLYSVVFVMPVFVGRVFHYDATQTGMLFIPGSLLTAFMMPFVGRAMQKIDSRALIAVGLIGIEVCLLMMAQFSTDSSKDQILHTMYVRGFAMALLFVPLNSAVLSQFTGSNLGQVSGLMNLSRQIGGSIGIAFVATLLNSASHQNHVDLAAHMSALNPQVYQTFQQIKAGMTSKMLTQMGTASADQAALKALYSRLSTQVFMLSFVQLVYIVSFVLLLAFIPLSLLRLKRKPTAVMDSH